MAALLILTGGGVVVFGYLANVGPLKDSGLAACESIRDQSNKNKTNHTTSTWSPEEYHAIRQQFTDSRYGDIRDAGTHLVDLIWQVGNMSDDQSLGVVMLAGGKIIESWSSLAGACENHGVTLPTLGASSVP